MAAKPANGTLQLCQIVLQYFNTLRGYCVILSHNATELA